MAPSRRSLLRAVGPTVALADLAGCTAGYHWTVPDAEPRNCPDEPRLPAPDHHPDDPDLPPVPDPPDALSDDAVTSYAHAYELAWAWRVATHASDGPVERAFVDAAFEVRNRTADAAIIQSFVLHHGQVHFPSSDADEPGNFDAAPLTVAYLVTVDAAWRVAKPRPSVVDTPMRPDPYREGRLVHCF